MIRSVVRPVKGPPGPGVVLLGQHADWDDVCGPQRLDNSRSIPAVFRKSMKNGNCDGPHIVTPQDRLSVPKVHAFVDFAAPRLQGQFARLAAGAGS